ncbi:hypothetical protein NX059_003092 [Plenodomus lindquistii]|nr:hypothetical protein NX059_003092 [Plenodomus lindquistii]
MSVVVKREVESEYEDDDDELNSEDDIDDSEIAEVDWSMAKAGPPIDGMESYIAR